MKKIIYEWICDQCGIKEITTEDKPPHNWGTIKHRTNDNEVFHVHDHECFELWLDVNRDLYDVNNETWSLYIQSDDPVSSVWPREVV